MSLLESLLIVSEKAADVARLCRQNQHLFHLLVQEKTPEESNPRFVDDFKTLADVLIQEIVKHDVGNKFPEIKESIFGEENNIFKNKLDEKITVKVLNNVQETKNLLKIVLNNDEEAASLLAEVTHKEISISDLKITENLPEVENLEDLAIWIDPIDSTAEYINGIENKIENTDIYTTGLNCVTVLIGVFNKKTNQPVIGIINQPFFQQNEQRGRIFWSVNNQNSLQKSQRLTKKICLSSSEDKSIKNKLKSNGWELIEASGAGYKCLLVILGLVDAYILSKNSTFKWDTCAPQAILTSMNGGIIKYQNAINGEIIPVNYDVFKGDNKLIECCNDGGIIAFSNKNVLECILNVLKT